MDAAFTQLLTTSRFPRTGSPEHPRGLGLVSWHCSVRPNAGASRAPSDLISRVFYLRKKRTPHPLPTKSLLEVPFFLHYPIFRLLLPSLSKSTRSFKDLNKESSLSRVLQLRGKKPLNEIWGKPPDGRFSKCGPRIPGGALAFSGFSWFSLFQLQSCGRLGFLTDFNPTQQTRTDRSRHETQLLTRPAN